MAKTKKRKRRVSKAKKLERQLLKKIKRLRRNLKRRIKRWRRAIKKQSRTALIALLLALILLLFSLYILLLPRHISDNSTSAGNHPRSHALALPSLYAQSNCKKGRLLNIVAHEDDDLLFMNPDLQHAIDAGICVRTVYMTAGDDGKPSSYWHGRALGAEAAYAVMFHTSSKWSVSSAVIESHEVDNAVLKDHPAVALTFLHLPDGNISGNGFSLHGEETLARLQNGQIKFIHTVDSSSTYNLTELLATLSEFMLLDKPTIIHTQAYGISGDHSDHQAVGYFTDMARRTYQRHYDFAAYIGYPIGHLPVNLTPSDIEQKTLVFKAYEHYDTTICSDTSGDYCPNQDTYINYLSRQYTSAAKPALSY